MVIISLGGLVSLLRLRPLSPRFDFFFFNPSIWVKVGMRLEVEVRDEDRKRREENSLSEVSLWYSLP